MSFAYKDIQSPVGKLRLVASDRGLVAVLWEDETPYRVRLGELSPEETHSVLVEAGRQLAEYFAGKRVSPSQLGRLPWSYDQVWRVYEDTKRTQELLVIPLSDRRFKRAVGNCKLNYFAAQMTTHEDA